MKKSILTLCIFFSCIMIAMAQKNNHDKITLSITRGGITNTIPVINFSYSFTKSVTDTTGGDKAAIVSVAYKTVSRFILESVSASADNSLTAVVALYDKDGKVKRTFNLSGASISDISGAYGPSDDEDTNSLTLTITSNHLEIDGVKLR